MKKAVFMFVLAGLASCSSDSSERIESTDGPIVGLWQLSDLKYQGVSVSGYSCNSSLDFLDFLNNGSYVVKYSDLNSQGNCVQFVDSGTYSKVGSVVTVVQIDGSKVIFERKSSVKELTSTKMTLETISQFEDFGNSGSEMSTYDSGEEIYIYNKVD